MRTYGRVRNANGTQSWVQVSTDATGANDYVYLTTLIQVLKLNLNESPFYANYGIPAHPSVVQQLFPDYYTTLTQQLFAPYFAALSISRVQTAPNSQQLEYLVNVITNAGVPLQMTVAT